MSGRVGEFGYFWLHRFHSMAGFLLAIAYLFLFLLPYSSAMQGVLSFNQTMSVLHGLPMFNSFCIVIVGALLIFYASLSFMIIHSSGANPVSYGRYRNWMYLLQRVAFLMILPALIYHVSNVTLKTAFGDRMIDFAMMNFALSKLWVNLLYIAGVLGAAFYIGNGLVLAMMGWGVAASKSSRDALAALGWVITFILAAWGLRVIFSFQG